MSYTVITPHVTEPLTLSEVKAALRVDGTDLDNDLSMMQHAAREVAEHETGQLLMTQTVRLDLPDWPDDLVIERAPVQSVTSVQYWDGAAWQTISSGAYSLWRDGTLWRVDPVSSWPSLGSGVGPRVRVTFVAGYASSADVPAAIKRYIIAQAGAWLRNPEGLSTVKLEASPLLSHLIDGQRVYS